MLPTRKQRIAERAAGFAVALLFAGTSISVMAGPDIIVAELQGAGNYGTVDGISAFSIGTISCNLGDSPADWFAATNHHPVISGGLYRLKDGRFEQLGISWLKHGFAALTMNLCGACQNPGTSQLLGVNCSDPYSAGLNGTQTNLGPRSEVNPLTGFFPFPPSNPAWSGPLARRIQVSNLDLDPLLNQGAIYFGEGHYIALDDAQSSNGLNNASHRRMLITGPNEQGAYSMMPSAMTQREKPAIRAWKANDPTVTESDVLVPNEGLFIAAAKASESGTGLWHYEYAVHNLNSDRAGGSFRVPIPPDAVIANVGFHDVNYHSGEPYDLTDWTITVANGAVTWSTTDYSLNPNANALRWGTLYNFRFDSNVQPGMGLVTLGLFKPGVPSQIAFTTVAPSPDLIDCNGNGIADAADIAQGTSLDCEPNGVPDECEPDCNENQVADPCDVTGGTSDDCNHNFVPDECEPDCDADGVPDTCETTLDTDQDGIEDCADNCPWTTPAGGCLCPPFGQCCFRFFGCVDGYPHDQCILDGGIPDCLEAPCNEGCLIGDGDGDGDLDLSDVYGLQRCFSASIDDPEYEAPTAECLFGFDYDHDNDVDLVDAAEFTTFQTGP